MGAQGRSRARRGAHHGVERTLTLTLSLSLILRHQGPRGARLVSDHSAWGRPTLTLTRTLTLTLSLARCVSRAWRRRATPSPARRTRAPSGSPCAPRRSAEGRSASPPPRAASGASESLTHLRLLSLGLLSRRAVVRALRSRSIGSAPAQGALARERDRAARTSHGLRMRRVPGTIGLSLDNSCVR